MSENKKETIVFLIKYSNKQCFIADVYEQYTTMVYQNPKLAAAAAKYGHSGIFGYCKLQKAIVDKQRRSPRKGNEKLTVKNKFHKQIFSVDYRVFIIVIIFFSNFIHFKFKIFHVFSSTCTILFKHLE